MLALSCHASTYRLWPLMIWVGVVSSVTPHLEWSPLCSPPNTHAFKPRRWHTIPTTLFETIWNGSVEVSNIMPTHFSVAPFTQLPHPHPHLTRCLCEESCRGPFFLLWHVVCVVRPGCWAVRRCCPAWPSCKPTTSQARRGWCRPWVRDTGPVPRATRLTRSTATTTTDTRFTTDKRSTATWAITQQAAVRPL